MVKNKTSKSAPEFGESFVLSVPAAKKIYRPTWVEINRAAFEKNIGVVRAALKPQTKILAVVKDNAYGHMAVPLLRGSEKEFAMLGVSSIEEGVVLRAGSIKKNILIMGSIYPLKNLKTCFEYGLIPTISSYDGVTELSSIALRLKKKLPFHLKVDTGMGRIGVSPQSAVKLLEQIGSLKSIRLDGVYTHFSSAGTDQEFTASQLAEFLSVVGYARKLGLSFSAHAANSDGIFLYPESHLDMVRPGLSLYGLWSGEGRRNDIELEPVLSWKTRIVFLKRVSQGTPISYGRTFTTKEPSVIATLPVGYADGLSRSLSNRGIVLIRGKRCPIVGRVTMDMIMADVSKVQGADVGDEAVLIGCQGAEKITAREMASILGTIAYETVCSIGYRVPRVLI